MRLKSRLERLERRLNAGAHKLALRQFFELLGKAIEGDELSAEEDRQLEELEQQLAAGTAAARRGNRRETGRASQNGGGDDPERLADDSTEGAELGRNSWVKSRDQGGSVNFPRRLQRLEPWTTEAQRPASEGSPRK